MRLSLHVSTYVFIALILILTSSALFIKWSILQPIHNEIVDKYRHNLSLFFEPHRICQVINYQKFNLIMFPMSCILILLFAIEHKRVSFVPHKCHGRFAPPVPVDFFTDINRTFVAVTFAICANELLVIVNNAFNTSISSDKGIVLVYLQQIFQILVMGFRYYPILSAVYMNSMSSLLLGTIYTWLEFPMTILEQNMCQPKYYTTVRTTEENFTNILLYYYGTGPLLVIIELLTDIPRYLCLSYLTIRLSSKAFQKIRYRSIVSEEKNVLLRAVESNSVEMLYLKNLFQHKRTLVSRGWMYEWRSDFRYSSRVLSVYSSIFLFLYFILIQGCVQLLPYMDLLQVKLHELFERFGGILSTHSIPLFVRPFLLAIVMGSIIVIIQLLLLLMSIRRNLFQVYRGEDSEIPRRDRSAYVNYAIGNFHFAGYLIGYVLWGFILIVFFIFILLVIIDALITFHAIRITELILKYFIPLLLFVYFKKYLNKCLARFAFLQDDGNVLAVNNRRSLMIFLYFNFFLDTFLGFLSSILRLVESMIGGIIYMCRIDYSPMGRKLETWDDGFSAYCGFIHTECTHRHPILLLFAGHLVDQINKKQKPISITNKLVSTDDLSIQIDEESRVRSLRIIRKWQLAVFLIRNPSIVFFRKVYFYQFHLFKHRTILDLQTSV